MTVNEILTELRNLSVYIKEKDGNLILSGKKENINSRLLNEIKNNKDSIISYIRSSKSTGSIETTKLSNTGFPLTLQQKSIWLASVKTETASLYNMPSMFIAEGELNTDAVKYAVDSIIKEHDSFRTAFFENDGEVLQQVHQNAAVEFEVITSESHSTINEIFNEFSSYIFNLTKPPLFRYKIVREKADKHYLLFNIHHLISDGWSVNIFFNDLAEYYNEYLNNGKPVERPTSFTFKNYIEYQGNYLQSPSAQSDKDYWTKSINDNFLPTVLPVKTNQDRYSLYEGESFRKNLSNDNVKQINNYCSSHGITPYLFYSSVLTLLLKRYTAQEIISFGTPFSCRSNVNFADTTGCFINTLPVITNTANIEYFNELIKAVSTSFSEVFNRQHYPAEKILEDVSANNNLPDGRLFNVIITYQNYTLNKIFPDGLSLKYCDTNFSRSITGLVLRVFENEEGATLNYEFSKKLYDRWFIEQFSSDFSDTIDYILSGKDIIRNNDLACIHKSSKTDEKLNRTAIGYPEGKTVPDYLSECFTRHSSRTALTVNGKNFTYKEIDEASDKLAGYLADNKKVSVNEIIGVMTGKNENLIISILAVLKCGAVYMPVNPAYPERRKDIMFKDSRCRIVLSEENQNTPLTEFINVNDILTNNAVPSKKLSVRITGNDPAYIIYTSGSTGIPKGVIITHTNLLRLFINDEPLFNFSSSDVWTLFHSPCFDFSIWEIFGPLLFGGRLVIVPDSTAKDPHAFYELLKNEKVTILNQTPGALYRLNPDKKDKLSLRMIILGGEALQPAKLKPWQQQFPGTKLINMYGITETTVHVTYKEITENDINSSISNIGIPIPSLGIIIVDKHLNPVPRGVPGQICVYGAGLAAGYLNQSLLTETRFSNILLYGRCYLSGDLGRMLENGDIEYLGRMDNQVQIRGFRVELNEIENALLKIKGIKDAVVLAAEKDEAITLKAYYTADTGISESEVYKELSFLLPAYMLPSSFIKVGNIPLTVNGKTDKKALLQLTSAGRNQVKQPYNETEKLILEAFRKTLGNIEIGTEDSFFVVGGDSIKALKLAGEINKSLGAGITIAAIYEHDTVSGLAKLCTSSGSSLFVKRTEEEKKLILAESASFIEKNSLTGIDYALPVSSIQKGMLYYSLLNASDSVYHDQFVYQLYIEDFSFERFVKSFELLVAKHIILRASFNLADYPEDVMFIHNRVSQLFDFEDLSKSTSTEAIDKINSYISDEREREFNPAVPPLWRLKVFMCPGSMVMLCWSFHHALLDGWSNSLLITELLGIYISYNSEIKDNTQFSDSYINFLAEQKIIILDTEVQEFWEKELDDYKFLELPVNENTADNMPVEEYYLNLPSALTDKLKNTAIELNTDLKVVYFSAFIYTLSMLSGDDDILAGIVTNNRPLTDDGDRIAGCFLNTVPFRTNTNYSTWKELIENISAGLKRIKKYEAFPFAEIVKLVKASTGTENPLFDVVFNFIDFNEYEQVYDEFSPVANGAVEYDIRGFENTNTTLNFTVSATLGKNNLKISYNPRKADSALVSRLAEYFERILIKEADEVSGFINNAEILSTDDKTLLNSINDTYRDFHINEPYHTLFSLAAKKYPTNTAVAAGGKELTYSELDKLSDSVALHLKNNSAKKGTVIAVITEPIAEFYAAMLGILKAGGVSLPVSLKTPGDRIITMLEDANAGIVISSEDYLKRTGLNVADILKTGCKLIPYKEIIYSQDIPVDLYSNTVPSSPEDPAYIVFTSGTTGRPKGIVYGHKSILNLCCWFNDYYSVTEKDRLTKYAEINYDANIWEIFPALLKGAAVYTIPDELKLDMPGLNKYFEDNKITSAYLPTPVVEQFLPENNKSLRVLTTGGEKLKNVSSQNFRIYNNYGPAEDTVCATVYPVKGNEGSIPIGKPIANNRIYILKYNSTQVLPPGTIGEICIAGESLSRGYLNDTTLNTSRFFETSDGERIYRTGDLGRFRSDGNLEFIGRKDRQVKIRGQRLEVEEIESILLQYPGIKSAVVAVDESHGEGNFYLKAFVVTMEKTVDKTVLDKYLDSKLPAYMIPSEYIFIGSIPLTVTGKTDYKTLLEYKSQGTSSTKQIFNDTSGRILKIWAEVLNKNTSDIDEGKNFFEQGGNSLNLIRIQRKINAEFNLSLPIADFLKYTSLNKLSEHIDSLNTKENKNTSSVKPVQTNSLANNNDDIAVIGMACRFAGANDINEFWKLLAGGTEAITFFSNEELKQAGVPENVIGNNSYVKAAGVITDPEAMDVPLFGYTDNEALIMDPQARLFHECVWSAFEDAGYQPASYTGRVGVFAGASKNNKWEEFAAGYEGTDPFTASLLSSKDNLASLISYKLNLRGPSINIYTACSTSLAAVHEACSSLKAGNCEMAVCGGVNLALPFIGGSISGEGSVFSNDGHCRPFSADGSGTVAGKGAGVVILKPLKTALADNDNIYAVIKKSAVNNDGYNKAGYTAPGIDGQAELFESIYNTEGIQPESISYIETHGTGTELGDMVEFESLKKTFVSAAPGSIALGSVKSNIGHTDTAAGIASLIKTILMLKNKTIVPTLHYTEANRKIDFSGTPFYIENKVRLWKQAAGKRRAGVSSFGIGGTNAHVVLEEYSETNERARKNNSLQIIPVSAFSDSAFSENIKALKNYVSEHDSIDINDIAFTLQNGRKAFQYRNAFVCSDIKDLLTALENNSYNKVLSGTKIGFMFPGQGTQYINMGRDLYESQPEFRKWFDICDELFRKFDPAINIHSVIYPQNDRESKTFIQETVSAHCSLFVFEFSLAKMLISFGIVPSFVTGHSLGEYTASCLAGILSPEDAVRLVIARGKLSGKVKGRMLSAVSNKETITELVNIFNSHGNEVTIAAINSDIHFIISGTEDSINNLHSFLESESIESRILHIDFPSHSPLMSGAVNELDIVLDSITHNEAEIPVLRNLDCRFTDKGEILPKSYWKEHLLNPVRFSEGISGLASDSNPLLLIEAGPGSVLSTFIKNISAAENKFTAVNVIPHPKEETEFNRYFYEKIAVLWCLGVPLNWNNIIENKPGRRTSLPTYRFDKIIYSTDRLLRKETDIRPAGWYYIKQWKQSPAPEVTIKPNDKLLIFAGNDELTSLIKAKYADNNVKIVNTGDCFSQMADKPYCINPAAEEDYFTLFEQLVKEGFVPDKVLHTIASGTNKSELNYEELINRQSVSFMSLIYIAKAASANSIENLSIAVVTGSLSDITGTEEINTTDSPLLSAVKVIPQEYAGFKTICIELDYDIRHNNLNYYADAVYRELNYELSDETGSQHIAYRNKKRWSPWLENKGMSVSIGTKPVFKKNGVYIVTGGAGNVGSVISSYLSEKYQPVLIITGRTKLPESPEPKDVIPGSSQDKIISRLKIFENAGAAVHYISADVSEINEMEKAFKYALDNYGHIDGIIHNAAATDDSSISVPLNRLTINSLERQFSVKVKGLLNIAELSKKYNPGTVIVSSSVSSLLGGIGFAAYSAANTVVESFVTHKNKEGNIRWFALVWDGWFFEDYLSSMYEGPRNTAITSEDGIKILSETDYDFGFDSVIISKRNLNSEIKKWLGNLYKDTHTEKETNKRYKDRPFLLTAYKKPADKIQQAVCEIWEEFFGISGIGINDHFFELGGDSLKATSVISVIHKKLGVKIPLAEFLKTPTIKNISVLVGQKAVEKYSTIVPAAPSAFYPLSSAQKRLFLLYNIEKDNLAYNIRTAIVLKGNPDKKRLEESFIKLLSRYESLRTSFILENGQPVQKIIDVSDIKFVLENVTDEDKFYRPFDLGNPPLIRAGIKKSGNDNILLIDVHHIVSDAVSMSIIFKELSLLYNGTELPQASLQYKDYSVWQNDTVAEDSLLKQKEFWCSSLSGERPVLNLPYDYKRPSVQSYEGDALTSDISQKQLDELKILAADNGTTLFVTLLSVFNVLLSKYGGQEDITLGTPTAGRKYDELKNIVGMFANTVVLRNKPESGITFRQFLNSVKDNFFSAFENQDYQFEDLVEDLKIERDISRNPLFDVMFVYINIDFSSQEMKGLKVEPYTLHNRISRFDLTLHCNEEADKINLTFEYCSRLFSPETIARMERHFRLLLNTIISNPDILLNDINLVDDAESDLLNSFNDTHKKYEENTLNVVSEFAERSKALKDKTAIVFTDKAKPSLSYQQVNVNTDKIAQAIIDTGCKPGSLAGVVSERNENMITAVMSIIKAGCGYVPADPYAPSDRAKYIFDDSNCSVVLCEARFADFVKDIYPGNIIVIDDIAAINSTVKSISLPDITGKSPLFLLYTSGSTGKPKGVLMPHRPIMTLITWLREKYPVKDEMILFLNPYTFDMSIWGLYAWAVNGTSVCVLKHGDERDPSKIVKALVEYPVTSLHMVPSMLTMILEYIESNPDSIRNTNLKYIFVSGEILNLNIVERFEKSFAGTDTELINFYGPTEAHVVSYFRTKEYNGSLYNSIPIGKPITNTRILVVDKNMNPVPAGITGEILLGGDCLADGYLNKTAITSEKFIYVNNRLTHGNERYYRTGDLGRWLKDGNIEFQGRNDFQIKIRGFRVEPGEVQSVINRIEGVKESLVLVKESTAGSKFLAAYIVFTDMSKFNEAYIRQELKNRLADYMIPACIIGMEKFPLNPNGKIERKLLPEAKPSGSGEKVITPRNKLEKKIADIWSNILEADNLGINDNFFDIGGNSLSIIRVHAELDKFAQGRLEVVDLFRYPTISLLAEYIKSKDESVSEKDNTSIKTRTDAQKNARRRRSAGNGNRDRNNE